jgi:hypothetical protein
MEATRFLPGVLSFLCAFSHLERNDHRPNHLFSQPQTPLSPGESVSPLPTSHMQSITVWPQQPMGKIDISFLKLVQRWKIDLMVIVLGQRSHAQAQSQEVDAHGFSRHNMGFSVQRRSETGSFRINHRILVQYRRIHRFSQSQTPGFWITGMHEGSLQNSGHSYCSKPVHAQAVR